MYVVPLPVVRAQKSLHMTPRALYSVCVGSCTHVNEVNGVVNGAVRVTFPVEILVRSPAISDDRSAGLELLGKRVQRCRSLPQASTTAIKVSAVLPGSIFTNHTCIRQWEAELCFGTNREAYSKKRHIYDLCAIDTTRT